MRDIFTFGAILLILAVAAALYAVYGDRSVAARDALREALERGEIRPQEYAAHLSALESAV